MAERKESSVLFSLRELRSIEEERVQEEEAAKQRAESERVRLEQEASRRVQDEAEAKRRSLEENERRTREDSERAAREERIRVEEAERRARVEAQERLEHQRLAKEMEIRALEAQKKRPMGLIVLAGGLVVALIVGGFMFYQHMQAAEKEKQELQLAIDANETRQQALMTEQKNLFEKRLQAGTEEEKRKLDEDIKKNEAKQKAEKEEMDRLRQKAGSGKPSKPREDKNPNVDRINKPKGCDPTKDPTCGL